MYLDVFIFNYLINKISFYALKRCRIYKKINLKAVKESLITIYHANLYEIVDPLFSKHLYEDTLSI